MTDRILRPNEQAKLLGVSRCTLWRFEQTDPTFPRKVKLGVSAAGRLESELMEWIESKKEV